MIIIISMSKISSLHQIRKSKITQMSIRQLNLIQMHLNEQRSARRQLVNIFV